MKRFRLNIGTKLFLLYFIVSSSLLWLFAQRTTFESAKSVLVEVSSLMSRVASQNNKDGEIDLETFETLIVNYLRSQRNTIDKNSPQKLENLAKKHDSKNIWLRPNPVDESKFFIDYENKLYLS